jgi:hypothetical protein
VWRRQVGFVRGTGGQRGQVRAAWWLERQDEVMDGFLVEPQKQGRAGTTWELSHEWRLAEATPSSWGLRCSPENHWVPWLIHKAKTEEPKLEVQQHRTGLTSGSNRSDRCATTQSRDFEAEDTHRDRKACVEAKQVCGRWASVQCSDDKDFQIHPRGACIPS